MAKYFLSNMYRFKTSYILMTITFGLRPMLKGMIHALLYEYWLAQIWTLMGIEILMVVIIVLFELVLDNHRSRVILFL